MVLGLIYLSLNQYCSDPDLPITTHNKTQDNLMISTQINGHVSKMDIRNTAVARKSKTQNKKGCDF